MQQTLTLDYEQAHETLTERMKLDPDLPQVLAEPLLRHAQTDRLMLWLVTTRPTTWRFRLRCAGQTLQERKLTAGTGLLTGLRTCCHEDQRSPHTVIQSRVERILHGSCRKPHHPSYDGLRRVDAENWMAHHEAATVMLSIFRHLLTQRRSFHIYPRLPEGRSAGERLWNHSGIGEVRLDKYGRPVHIRQLNAVKGETDSRKGVGWNDLRVT